MKFKHSYLLGLICFCLLGILVMATAPPAHDLVEIVDDWQPPLIDTTLKGDGTGENLLGVAHPVLYDSYYAVLAQSSTNAPTQTVLQNSINTTKNVTWAYTGTGVYTGDLDDDDLTTGKIFLAINIGNATGLCGKVESPNDSTVIVRVFDAAGAAANLAGGAYLEIKRFL